MRVLYLNIPIFFANADMRDAFEYLANSDEELEISSYHYVYYEDRQELIDKVDYYLHNDEERAEIARNAHEKIIREHTFDIRALQIIEMVKDKMKVI